MPDVLFLYLACFFLSLIVTIATSVAFLGRLLRRCTQLEWAVGDIQSRLSSFKGKELAEKRWQKRDELESAIMNSVQGSPSTLSRGGRKYDNDPLGME